MPSTKVNWFESTDVVPMFPTLVWKLQLRAEFHRAMQEKILAAIEKRGLPRLRNGEAWQSERNLHLAEELRELSSSVEQATASVLRFLHIGYDAFHIAGCWANVLAQGASHRAHSHPNNYLSGVYYVRTAPGADTINFHDPRAQTGIIRPPVTELTGENTDQIVMRVTEGTLLLFPAYLQHSVDANPGEEPRISVSFNVMFSGFAENLSKPLW